MILFNLPRKVQIEKKIQNLEITCIQDTRTEEKQVIAN